jgi:hypothetical protein
MKKDQLLEKLGISGARAQLTGEDSKPQLVSGYDELLT